MIRYCNQIGKCGSHDVSEVQKVFRASDSLAQLAQEGAVELETIQNRLKATVRSTRVEDERYAQLADLATDLADDTRSELKEPTQERHRELKSRVCIHRESSGVGPFF